MTSSFVSPQSAATPASVAWRPGWPSRIFALTPLWVLIISPLAAPRFFEPLGGEYPNILGLNLGVIVTALALFWMLIGLYVLWNATTRWVEALVYTVFTIPATMAVLLTPALVLIMQNLG